MNSTSIFLPASQQDSSGFWTDQERSFPDGANQVQTLMLAPVAQKSQPLPLHSHPLSRENKLRACPEPRGSEKNDSGEGSTYVPQNVATSADEEKGLLLHKTIELRRLNKELMKLNQEWDHIYHMTTLQMQQKMSTLQMEVGSLKQRVEHLTVKFEHEQNKKEYYEQAFLQEFKKNQQLQEYVKYLESKVHQNNERRTLANFLEGYGTSPIMLSRRSLKDSALKVQGNTKGQKTMCCKHQLDIPNSEKELIDLIDELETLKCQTEMFEADPLTEHMKAENENLHRKEEEIRQQMALLQEQLKIFEEDFKKERSDKQVFQQLLSKSHGKSAISGACEGKSKEKVYASAIGASAKSRPGSYSKHCSEGMKYSRKQEPETQVPPSY